MRETIKIRDLWGSSHDLSSAITGKSAKLLGIPGYTSTRGGARAQEAAVLLLNEVCLSRPTRRRLWHGESASPAQEASFRVGATLGLPLIAASTDQDEARGYDRRTNPHGDNRTAAILLCFEIGTYAILYADTEWLTAGTFVVQKVVRGKDPFWGTPRTLVSLKQVSKPRLCGTP